ncbi:MULTISPECIES: hypothetical protein [unclassified Spiroplasma]|uniref:hypothetical protein n=1 Tax=unclassified Spiroplasma TaxID=2637901 RepID=UPI0030CB14C5
MKKYLSILTALTLTTGTSLVTSSMVNSNVIKTNQLSEIKESVSWTTKIAHVAGFNFKDSQTSSISKTVSNIDTSIRSYKLLLKDSKVGYCWSDGSNAGWQDQVVYSQKEFKINFGEQNKKFKLSSGIFVNKTKTAAIGYTDLYLYISYNHEGLTYKFEQINQAFQSALFGWAKTGAEYNFEFDIIPS